MVLAFPDVLGSHKQEVAVLQLYKLFLKSHTRIYLHVRNRKGSLLGWEALWDALSALNRVKWASLKI